MASSLDTVTSSIGSSLDFATKNFREIATRIAKIYLLSFAILIAAAIALGVLFLAFGGLSLLSGNAALLLPLIILAVVVLVAVGIVNASINMVRFVSVEDVSKKKETGIIATATKLVPAVLVYSIGCLILVAVFVAVPMLIGAVAAFSSGSPSGVGIAVFILGMVIGVLLAIILSLFIQFASLDIAINKSGGIDALRNSYALVRKNLATVVIYDIILFLISFAVGMVFGIINEVISFGMTLGAFNIALLAVMVALYLVVIFAESVLINTVLTPVEYFFWKAIGGKR
jgi:hypothetical protein